MTIPANPTDTLQCETLRQQALALKLHGLIANWDTLPESPTCRSYSGSSLGKISSASDADWNGGWAPLTSVVSSRWRTSPGTGHNSVTGRRCRT